MAKNLYVIAGPNGAGKTTFAKEFLPHFAHCEEFVNADLIATGLSPFDPGAVAMQAGRLVVTRIRELVRDKHDFGFETTLSGRAYLRLLKNAKKRGFRLRLFFLWLPDENLAVKRVADRVRQGGHNVPELDIRRRYGRGLINFWTLYRPLIQDWVFFDNSQQIPRVILYGQETGYNVVDLAAWEGLKRKWL
jgi:predicted ABC-type ATPase